MAISVSIAGPRRAPRLALAAFLIICLAPGTAHRTAARENEEAAGDYALDTNHASLLWKVNHLGFSTYVGRFNRFDATLTFDPEFPTASKMTVTIDAASLDVNNADFEQKLKGADWFDTAAHPQIRFVSTKVEKTGVKTGRVTGALTFMGVTKPATLNVELTGRGRHLRSGLYTVGFSASGTLDRTDFGLDRLAPLIGKDVTLEIHAEFTRQ